MTDFRALCAELTEKLDDLNCSYNIPSQSALVERARAALAQPEPEGPTDKELYEAWYASNGPRCFARAVLARWGTPNSAEIRRLLGEPAECPACEGQPAPSNTPCAVCGVEIRQKLNAIAAKLEALANG